jgi:hypothetical protein
VSIRFTIRDIMWSTVVVAIITIWQVDRVGLLRVAEHLQADREKSLFQVKALEAAYTDDGLEVTFMSNGDEVHIKRRQ